MGKIQKFVRRVANDKYFTVFVYSDPNAMEQMLVGPEHTIIITNRDEVDSYINRFFDLDLTCVRCRKYGNKYFRVEIRPDGDVGRAVCGDCDPTIKFAVAYFEVIDPLIAPVGSTT
jgi:hypothetical protein